MLLRRMLLLVVVGVAAVGCGPGCSEPPVLGETGEGEGESVVVVVGVSDDDGVAAEPRCPDLPPADDPLEVQTKNATVKGFIDDEGVAVWKGIRYAEAPVGALRFNKTVPAACEADVVDATEDPNQCPQLGADLDVVVGDEDCLFLNVFRPERRDDEDRALLPVLFFIHGGGEILGSGNQPTGVGNLYDGSRLATESRSVVVTINHRLGALGFLAHPSLSNADGAVGNWGHHDILTALRWSHDNIAAFGGDPEHTAIFGESAGAHNVCVMLASPLSKGLFQAAIMESGGCEVAPLDQRESEGATTAADIGCDDAGDDEAVAACLRSKSAESFVRLISPIPPLIHTWWLPYGSTIDGEVLTDQPLAIIRRGEQNQVPFIAGSNKEEANLFLFADGSLTCFDLRLQFQTLLTSSYDTTEERDAVVDELLERYECSSRFITRDLLIEAATDLEFTCQAQRVAAAMASSQTQPVYRYHFADRANLGTFAAMGAFHAWELFYVFDSFETGLYLPSTGEVELAKIMQRSWGRMARDGNPNGGDDVNWPVYRGSGDDILEFDEDPFAAFGGAPDVSAVEDPAPECDFWDRVAPAP